MNTTPCWFDTAAIQSFPPCGEDLTVDVLIVGAGITGATAAYLLKKAGLNVALAEREKIATVDTGHTTAHLTHVTDTRLSELEKNFGRDHAQAAWDAGAAAIDQIEELVRNENIDCEFSRVPGFLHAPLNGGTRDERPAFREDARLAAELGFEAAYLDEIPHFKAPGVRFANQAKFHPRKYVAALIRALAEAGGHIFEKSAVSEFDREKARAKVNGHWLQYEKVVVATHNPLSGEAGFVSSTLLQTKLALYTTYVLGAQIPRGAAPIASFWDTNDPYQYLRIDRHEAFDYAIFGGEDHKTGQIPDTETPFRRLEDALRVALPEATVDHRWSGQVIETNDGLPFIGEEAGHQFIGTGYSGNGMTFGTITAMMARDWVIGSKNPWTDLFHVDRKKIRGGAWDYLRENKDYPYYLIKSRLSAAEGDSTRMVENNEGKILKIGGEKIAAYRDGEGNLTKCSAICPHMGCVVRWNQAESTWDCPCHGSRFKPTGEVLSGPAQSPLAPA